MAAAQRLLEQHALGVEQPVLAERRGARAQQLVGGHGLVRKRKIWPSLTARMAASSRSGR